jgi:prepilin-type N-terminal cleavage/methylation domain-containing protein
MPIDRPQSPATRAAFTILELIVVLTVLSIVASVGIPAYFGRATVTLDNAAKLLAKDLREVQNRAALYEETLWVRFEADGTGYRVTDDSGDALVSPYGNGDYLRDYPLDAVFLGVEIPRREPEAVAFDASGRPLTSLSVTLTFEGEERTVTMREQSGLIAIDGLDEPWIDVWH